MSEIQPVGKAAQLKDIEAIRDLFARAHDYMAQATHPGHLGMKVAEVLNFLSFQYNDFKIRAERLAVEVETEAATIAKRESSKVDVAAAVEATAEVLDAGIPKA